MGLPRSAIYDQLSTIPLLCFSLRPWRLGSEFLLQLPRGDDADAGVATEVVFSFFAFPIEEFSGAVLIVDDGKIFNFPAIAEP